MASGKLLNCITARASSPRKVPACVPPSVVAALVAKSGLMMAVSLSSASMPK